MRRPGRCAHLLRACVTSPARPAVALATGLFGPVFGLAAWWAALGFPMHATQVWRVILLSMTYIALW
eukprot:gene5579-5551_t